MSLLNILELPHPRLRNVAAGIDSARVVEPAFQRLLDDMFETMYTAPGIGLAATQVDVHERFMVIDVSEERDTPLVFVNPVIRHRSEQLRAHQEGCLSIPGIFADVTRADGIAVEALDRHGKAFTMQVDDLLATCVQHEIDHLDGKLFIDHLSSLKRERALKKYEKLRKGGRVVGRVQPGPGTRLRGLGKASVRSANDAKDAKKSSDDGGRYLAAPRHRTHSIAVFASFASFADSCFGACRVPSLESRAPAFPA